MPANGKHCRWNQRNRKDKPSTLMPHLVHSIVVLAEVSYVPFHIVSPSRSSITNSVVSPLENDRRRPSSPTTAATAGTSGVATTVTALANKSCEPLANGNAVSQSTRCRSLLASPAQQRRIIQAKLEWSFVPHLLLRCRRNSSAVLSIAPLLSSLCPWWSALLSRLRCC